MGSRNYTANCPDFICYTFAAELKGVENMDKYLLPEDDGLPARIFGKWTSVKLEYLRRYIGLLETSMRGKPWCARCYIDLYAGSGKYQIDGQSGFPLGS